MAVVEEFSPTTPEVIPAGRQREWGRLAASGAFIAYAGLIAVVIAHHEPWFDEAQAWLIARESSFRELLEVLPYEGQPGLWHLLLMLPSRTLPYETLNWISGLLGALGILLFLRKAPFPTPVKLLVPFTYFLFYQYGVVARNYALMPLVMFALAAVYQKRHRRPASFGSLLFVMANTSTHGFVIAACFLGIFAVEALAEARRTGWRARRSDVLTVGLVGLAMAALAYAMVPPADRTSGGDVMVVQSLWDFIRVTTGMLKGSLAGELRMLPLVLLPSLWFFYRRKVLTLYVLPTTVLLLFFAFVYRAPWHEGVLFLVWLFALWVGYQSEAPEDLIDQRSRKMALAALVVVCIVQIGWSAQASLADFRNPYSGSKELAAYLKHVGAEDKTVYGVHWASIAVNAYFDENLFANYNPPGKPAYWMWSERNHMVQDFEMIEALQPDYIVFPVKVSGMEEEAEESLVSYRQKAVFWGQLYWKGTIHEPDVYILYQRKS